MARRAKLSEWMGRFGTRSSAVSRRITFLCPQWSAGVWPIWVHSKPRNATTSGLGPSPATALHWRTAFLVSRHMRGVSPSAWSVIAQKSRAAQ